MTLMRPNSVLALQGPPLVQALHVELQTNRAIVFTTDAVLIPR